MNITKQAAEAVTKQNVRESCAHRLGPFIFAYSEMNSDTDTVRFWSFLISLPFDMAVQMVVQRSRKDGK